MGSPATSHRRSALASLILCGPAVLLYGAFVILPTILGFAYSLTNWSGWTSDPKFVGLANFRELVGDKPVKNPHSHPGDAMGYGAAVLFPLGRLQPRRKGAIKRVGAAIHFGHKQFIGQRGLKLPPEAHTIGAPDGRTR